MIFLFSFSGYSQSLTNRQVYDFEVGDVFQVSYSSGMSGGQFRDTIVGKSFSIDNDTVFYQINQVGNSSSNWSFIYSSFTRSYTDLDSIATHHTLEQCLTSPPPTDTLYPEALYCDQLTWRKTSNHDLNCFEDNYYLSDLIVGCGGPYFYGDVGIGGPASYNYRLTYFKKDSVSCGNAFTTGIEENQLENNIKLFPNPSNSTIQVTMLNPISIKKYAINDVFGKNIGEYDYSNSIDISNLKSGIYFITFLGSDFRKITKKIIKE